MNNKEKRALENVKSLLLYSSEHEYFSPFKEEEIDDMNIVLKLVENLISENKELKEEKEHLIEINNKYNDMKYITRIAMLYIPKSKVEEILDKYKYTEIEDSEKIIQFYKELQSLLGKE